VEPGDAVAQGSSLFVLSTTGETRLRIEPDERNLALLERGQKAEASSEAFPDRRFEANLSYIAPAVDPERGTIEVRLLVPKPPSYLRAHMSVSVEVVVAQKKKALVVPRRSILNILESPSVLVIRSGAVVRQKVSLGIEGDLAVEIVDGLNSDDVLVSEPRAVTVGQKAKARLDVDRPQG
jgi:HlyD family secretion protein